MPAKRKPDEEVPADLGGVVLDVVRSLDRPLTPSGVAELTALDPSRVAEALDDLVSEGLLTLGDDLFYRLIEPTTSEADEAEVLAGDGIDGLAEAAVAPSVTIEGDYDDAPELVYSEGAMNTVLLPTSDLLRFLTNINLPPQLIVGLGTLSDLRGTLTYEIAEATPEDPHPRRRFHVDVYGHHVGHPAALNPNQPGYVEKV